MRYRLMATYRGSPFEAGVGPTDGDIVLFAACPPPEELGFEPATGHWRKQLRFADVQAVWESRPVGTFRGERCMVLDDLGDRLHIGYLGHDGFKAEQLGYWQVDRGVFELVAPRSEISDILEERTEYPPPGSAQPGSAQPGSMSPHSGGYPVPFAAADSAGYLSPSAQPEPTGYLLPPAPEGAGYWEPEPVTGSFAAAGGYGGTDAPVIVSPSGAYQSVPDLSTGVALPIAAEAPLPLEAEAMRAASASRQPRQTGSQRRNGTAPADAELPVSAPGPVSAQLPVSPTDLAAAPLPSAGTAPAAAEMQVTAPAAAPVTSPNPATSHDSAPVRVPGPPQAEAVHAEAMNARATLTSEPLAGPAPVVAPAPLAGLPGGPGLAGGPGQPGESSQPAQPDTEGPTRQRRAARRRMATERLFADLASLAGIPADSYAVGEEVEGALCLIQTEQGFEVFHSADGARHELQVFTSEESACFYLFGVLAAEAVRNGSLTRGPGNLASRRAQTA